MRKVSPTKSFENKSSPLACIKTMLKHELQKRLYNVSTLFFLAAFLFFLNLCIFIVGDFLDSNLATLTLQLKFLPWISMIFLPAMAMQAFGGHQRGEGDLILSYPIPFYATIIGKWLAGIYLVIFALLLTLPFAVTVGTLGEPDWGIAAAGYLSVFLAMSLFYAIAIFAATICKDEVSSFLLGSSSILLLLFADINALQTSLIPEILIEFSHNLFALSPKHWMDEIATGYIGLSAILYFVLSTGLCLMLACHQLRGQYSASRFSNFLPFFGIFGLLLTILLSSKVADSLDAFDIHFDVTENKEYTFRQETKEIARSAPLGTEIQLYVSRDRSTIPPNIIQHINRVERAIATISKYSDGRINATVTNLQPDTELAETTEVAGVRQLPMSSGDILYFGAIFKAQNRSLVTSYFDFNRATTLEYDLALQLSNLTREKTPNVGILSSVLKPSNVNLPHPGLSILEELKSQYDVSIIPYFAERLEENYDAIIIFDAPIIRSTLLEDIDSHIQAGRGAIIMLDPFQRMNRANARLNVKPSAEGKINSIRDLLEHYGLKNSADRILGDFKNAAIVETTDGRNFSYPYWLQVRDANISKDHIVSANLSELLFAEAGFFELINKNISVEPLITTSTETNLISKKEAQENSTENLALNFKSKNNKRGMLAVYLSGVINSPFKNKSESNSDPETSVFAIADVDWIYNGFSLADARMGDRVFSRPINDNHKLFLNMVEYITGDTQLTNVRSRPSPIRTFTSIEAMLLDSRRMYHERESDYAARIRSVEQSIAEVIKMTGAKNIDNLPASLREQIRNLQLAAHPVRRELREIRSKMREDVIDRFKTLTIVNLLAGPTLALIVFLFIRRMRKVQS